MDGYFPLYGEEPQSLQGYGQYVGGAQYREESLRALHADLLQALSVNNEAAQADIMRDVVDRMEGLLASDAAERAGRLGELEAKQQQLFELHNLVQQNEQEGIQQVTSLCKESISHLIHECKLYHEELDRLRRENSSLQQIKSEFQLLRLEGNGMLAALDEAKEKSRHLESQVNPTREKAETLAIHLVEAVKEKHIMEETIERLTTDLNKATQDNTRLADEAKQSEGRLAAFEEAAQADISELLERDAQQKQALEQMKKSTTNFDEYKHQHNMQVNQIGNLEARCKTLSAELAAKCKELDAMRAQTSEVETKQRAKVSDLETACQVRMRDAEEKHRAQLSELATTYQAHMQEAENKLTDVQQHDTQCIDSAQGEVVSLRDNVERLTAELTRKCQECATVSVKLNTANEELEEKTALLSSIKDEVMLMRDASDHSKHETVQTLDSLQAELRAKEDAVHELAEEVKRLQRCEGELQAVLESVRTQSESQARRVQGDVKKVTDLEVLLETERKAKDDLSQTVMELQKQTLSLAQEKGRLISELAVRRTQQSMYPASLTPQSGVSIEGPSEDVRQIAIREPVKEPPLVLPSPQPSSRITVLEEKLSKMKVELQGMVKGHNPLQ